MLGMLGIETMPMVVKAPKKWVKNSPMALDFMTCMEIFMSGLLIGGDAVSHRPVQTRTAGLQVPTASDVVATGAAPRTACGRRRAVSTSSRRTATAASGSV